MKHVLIRFIPYSLFITQNKFCIVIIENAFNIFYSFLSVIVKLIEFSYI